MVIERRSRRGCRLRRDKLVIRAQSSKVLGSLWIRVCRILVNGVKRETSMIRSLQHLGNSSLLSYLLCEFEFTSKKFLFNSCLRVTKYELGLFEDTFLGRFLTPWAKRCLPTWGAWWVYSSLSGKEIKAAILVGVMDIERLMIRVKQIEN